MVDKIKLFARYILSLGWINGISVFLQMEVIHSKKLFLKNYNSPVYYRIRSADIMVFKEVFIFKSYELPIRNVKIILDGGAHIGLSSLYFMNRYPGTIVYAVEPDPGNFELLKRNTENYTGFHLIQGALWKSNTTLKIINDSDQSWAYRVEEVPQRQSESINGITIQSIMEKFDIDRFDLLKLDVESAEAELFAENYKYWLTRTSNILIELHDWSGKDCSRSVFRTISQYNFSTKIVHGMIWFKNRDLSD